MQSNQRILAAINVVGGLAVLGSYAWGFIARPDAMGALWGGVPEGARGLYTINMFLAAGGYFLFTFYIVFRRLRSASERAEAPSPTSFAVLYTTILIPSALWLPMTSVMVNSPSPTLWWLIRVDLALVAAGSVGVLILISADRLREWTRARVLAVVGLFPFCLQTVVLDAIVWPIYFAHPGG